MKRKKWIVAAVVFAIAVAIYFLFNPSESEFFPKCPFLLVTGLKCPGCGSQRALHYLFHGQVFSAFLVNPLLVLSIPYLLTGVYFEYFGGNRKYPVVRKTLFGAKACLIIFTIVVTYAVARNIWGW